MKAKKKIAPLYPISSTPVSAQVKPLLSDQEKRFLELLADSFIKNKILYDKNFKTAKQGYR